MVQNASREKVKKEASYSIETYTTIPLTLRRCRTAIVNILVRRSISTHLCPSDPVLVKALAGVRQAHQLNA